MCAVLALAPVHFIREALTMRAGRHFHSYKQPAKDSPKAIASATLFLCGAVSIDHVTAESLAHRYHLSLKRAEYLLTISKQRRGDG